MNPIDDMLLFARLMELKSFSAVADAVQISRSMVSKRISRLEDRLGVQLLNRTTRRLEPTEAGRMFYRYCRQMESTWQEAEDAVGEIRSRPKGVLRVNAPVTFGQLVLPRIVSGFLAEFPDIQIALSLSDHYVNVIEDGYDLVIRVGKLRDSSLRARQLGVSRLRLYAHVNYLERHGMPETPQDLTRHNCLLYRHQRTGPNEWEFHGPHGAEAVTVQGNLSADNGIPLYEAAMNGLGIARVPRFTEQAFSREGMVYLLEDYAVEVGVHAVYATTRKPPLNTRFFIDYMAGHLPVL